MAKDPRPPMQFEKRDGRLMPVTVYDAERGEEYGEGQLFTVTPVSNRSKPA